MAYVGGYILIPFLAALVTKYQFKQRKVWHIAFLSYLAIPIVNFAIYASVPEEMITNSLTHYRGNEWIPPSDHIIDVAFFVVMMAVPVTLATLQVRMSKSCKEV
ncbi:hypothetical protein [Aureimonas pseudogalii]|uniref:NhaP-type Na+/H+ or K+/H+ antiporter n=1 Tax=Aureimonas pseudogalii TaxID=1744844 RepID=A0A7W6H7P9_9HYPH|nr:hypothetical protein [Aureimonas pseudogalii]MBB4000128.1 NhaP-type Na+/H+ or K+/H+ antiporter [Aureimonas pseudogalii]